MNQRKALIGVSFLLSISVVGTDCVYRYNFKTITDIRP